MKSCSRGDHPEVRDYGSEPIAFNLRHATTMNQSFRTALWTGCHLQLTVMSIPAKSDIGAEMHSDVDQLIYVERGQARVLMGHCKSSLREMGCIAEGYAVIIPAGTWHNIVNAGCRSLKVFSIYAPPQHPVGTVHKTKADADGCGH